jgi:hypothetical protein
MTNDQQSTTNGITSFRLPEETIRKMNAYCRNCDLTKSQLLRRLLASYEPLKHQEPEPPKQTWLVNQR